MGKTRRDTIFCGPDADRYLRSEDLLLACGESFVLPDDIPGDLLRAWTIDEPVRMLMESIDQKTVPEFTLPYAVYARAYELHDLYYEKIRKRPFRTPAETKMLNFIRYQELLRIIARFRARRIALPPFQVFHFMEYRVTCPAVRTYAGFYLTDKF